MFDAQTQKKEKKLDKIPDFMIFDEQKNDLTDYQKEELDKTEQRVEKELLKNGYIKTYSVKNSYQKITDFINNLYKV